MSYLKRMKGVKHICTFACVVAAKGKLVPGGIILSSALITSALVGSTVAQAQTVPSDLVEFSLEDLFSANILTSQEENIAKKRWHISYNFATSRFDEYYINQNSVSYEDVLWRPGEQRTGDNYPVVPTEISQDVHAFLVGYDFSPTITLRASLPFIRQSSDHISIVPGYDAFNITSDGVGDAVFLADFVVARNLNSVWRVGAGISVPTGSIDEEGDTPRAPGNQQLPYTMQIGSGTWDIPLALAYEKYDEGFRWGGAIRGTWRTGKNDRDYRLGHKLSSEAWVTFSQWGVLRPGLRLTYRWQGTIQGQDTSLSIPNPVFPYPAPVVDPDDFGGEQIDLAGYLEADLGGQGWTARLEYSRPVFLDLNGPQSAEDFHVSLKIGTSF
jgi:hypothetical protein